MQSQNFKNGMLWIVSKENVQIVVVVTNDAQDSASF
jgi:hypothetical protein